MLRTIILSLSFASCSLCHAQSESILSGPRVESQDRPSLVASGLTSPGQLALQLDQRPELAAIELLDLDAQTRSRVDAVLLEYARVSDEVFRDHLLQIQGWTQSLKSGAVRERLAAAQALLAAYEPVSSLGPLDERIRAVLGDAQAKLYTAMLDEYEHALEADAQRKSEAAGEPFSPIKFRIKRRLTKIGQDLKASYERTLVIDQADFEAFLSQAQLSASGERALRDAVRALGERTGFNPTPNERQQMLIEVMRELNAADRGKLIRTAGDR